MSAAHTPGPWSLTTFAGGSMAIQPRVGFMVAPVKPRAGFEQDIPNFTLMTAAPELLAVLERLSLCVAGMDQFSLDEDFEAARDQARDVIAKAKGTV